MQWPVALWKARPSTLPPASAPHRSPCRRQALGHTEVGWTGVGADGYIYFKRKRTVDEMASFSFSCFEATKHMRNVLFFSFKF